MKTCVITGATNGIGYETAKALAKEGYAICIVGRSQSKCQNTVKSISELTGNKNISYVLADLGLVSSTRKAAQEIAKKFPIIDVLVNNAGISTDRYQQTAEGIEIVYATNHLSQVIMTLELLPNIKKSADGRIVNVSSRLHEFAKYNSSNPMLKNESNYVLKSYNQSKLLNVMMTMEFSEREKENKNLSITALHPGSVNTGIGREIKNPILSFLFKQVNRFTLSPEEGAQTTIYLALAPEIKGVKGKYYVKKREAKVNPQALDANLRKQAWSYSMQVIESVRSQ